MELKRTEHYYYCSNENYDSGEGFSYDCWGEFKEHWEPETIDHDYNHVFRFDIKEQYDEEGEEIKDHYALHLYYMLQRKGKFVPVIIKNIQQSDMPEVNKYLDECWSYIRNQWKEFVN